MKKILSLIVTSSLLIGCQPSMPDTPPDSSYSGNDKIHVFTPSAGETLSTPFEITGEAVGSWYFEGFFPITIVTSDNTEIYSGAVQAKGEWMTEDFVPFSLTVEDLDDNAAETGKIIFQKDNPSGLPENDDSFELEVQLP